jgi:penicillin-binding protein 2
VLEEHRTEFPNLIIQSTPKRWYPDGPAVAGFIGYTGEISETELTNPRYKGYKAGMRIGKRGLEQQYEPQLRGREGYRFVEVDARGRVVREQGARDVENPVAAPPLYTNIDLDLQRFTATLFGDTLQGAAVALDPQTGGVLALYSAPSYDPNRFTGGIPKAYWDSLNTDPRRPMYNKAVQGRYAPGSTFKLATAIAGLENHVVDLDSRMDVPCSGGMYFGNRYWRCWDKRGHGSVTLAQAIEKSCDVYFYQLGLKLQLARLVAGGVALKFNEKSGIDLPSETRPEFPDAIEYFRRRYGRNYVAASTAMNMSIGQGENAQTVINMARFYVALANDGITARPTIARLSTARQRIYTLPPDQLKGIRAALAGVVSERGTAAGAAIQGLVIAGKTGTAQSGTFDKLTGKELNHAWFTGFAPAESPRIVVAVMLENVPFHGSVSALIASKMIGHYLKGNASVTEAVTNGG